MLAFIGGAWRFCLEIVRVAIFRRRRTEILGFLMLAIVCIAVSFAFDGIVRLFDLPLDAFTENGPVETAQSVIVGLAAVLFYVAALRFDFEIFYGALVVAFLCALAVLREIPGCGSAFYEGGVCLTNGAKDVMTIGAALAVVGLALVRREPLAKRLADLNFFWIVPLFFAGSILVVSEVMEHAHAVGIEETLETSGYLVLVGFAMLVNLRPDWFDARQVPFE